MTEFELFKDGDHVISPDGKGVVVGERWTRGVHGYWWNLVKFEVSPFPDESLRCAYLASRLKRADPAPTESAKEE